jgi:hypothetical protein
MTEQAHDAPERSAVGRRGVTGLVTFVRACACACGLDATTPAYPADEALPLPPEIIALDGHRLPGLLGAAPADVRAFVVRPGGLTAVRVQIDERFLDAEGALVFALETGAEPRSDPDESFDHDDVLLLWLPDAGARLGEFARRGLIEVHVVDDRAPERWFYLARAPATPRTSLPPLITYEDDVVAGEEYTLGFAKDGGAVIDRLTLGSGGPNLLDRSKARLRCRLAFGLRAFERTEADVAVRVTGLRVGPLRILRETAARGRLLWGIYSPEVREMFVFTPRTFMLPVTLRVSPALRYLVREAELRITMDLDTSARGLIFSSSVAPGIVDVIDGSGTPEPFRQPETPFDWYLLRAGTRGLLGWASTHPDYARLITPYYRDDRTSLDPPEHVAGEFGHHGFRFRSAALPLEGEIRITAYGRILGLVQMRHIPAEMARFKTRPRVVVHDANVSD